MRTGCGCEEVFREVSRRRWRFMRRFSTGRGGYSGGHGGFLVVACEWLRASAERTVSSIGIANSQSAYAFLNLKARAPVRGWVLFGGHLGGRSETTSDSDRERFLSYVMTQKTSNLSPLHGGCHSARGGGHSEVFCGEGRRFFRRRGSDERNEDYARFCGLFYYFIWRNLRNLRK
jgi:hypothetical protein